jgi:hypothetical protein
MAAVVILALDSVVMLHTRRAMAEGTLLFTVILFLYLSFTTDNPWLLGISAGLAFCAKQSTLPLVGVGLLAILWCTHGPKKSLQNFILRGGIYAVSFLGLILLLNPFLWAHPIDAVGSALWARQDLISRQNADTQRLAPGTLLDTPLNKSIAMVAQVYYLPTTYEEIGNYRNEITAQANLYMQSPFVNWLRGPIAGSVLLFLTLWGIITSLASLRRCPFSRRNVVLLSSLTLTQAAALLVSLSLSWQRYYIPMFPYMAFWSAVGMYELLLFFQKLSTLRLRRL